MRTGMDLLATGKSGEIRPTDLTRASVAPVMMILAAILVVEMALVGADAGLWGEHGWRANAYRSGAFWPALTQGSQPLYDGQPWAMWVSHAFLHTGPLHMAANAVTLLSIGMPVGAQLGIGRFSLVYLAGVLGGAWGYALLAYQAQPMVGASGALFAVAGAWLVLQGRGALRGGDYRDAIAACTPPAMLLVAMNAIGHWIMSGGLAWQAHLGGFIAGVLVTLPGRRLIGGVA